MFQPNMFESHHHLLDMTSARSSESEVLKMRDIEDFETKSGTETMEPDPSGDDVQNPNNDDNNNNNGQRQKRKRYHRHTQRQIQELEG